MKYMYMLHTVKQNAFLSSCRVVWARCQWNEGDILGCCLSISNVTQRCILLKTTCLNSGRHRKREREREWKNQILTCMYFVWTFLDK